MSDRKLFERKVFLVNREGVGTDGLTGTLNTGAFLGSSLAACEKFFRDNTDYDLRVPERPWWWTVFTEYIDYDVFETDLFKRYADSGLILTVYDWDGVEINERPHPYTRVLDPAF